MSTKQWFRFHIARWRDGTLGLSANQISTYLAVTCELYSQDGHFKMTPTSERILATRAGVRPSTFRRSLEELVALGKIDILKGYVTSRGVTNEISEREKIGQKLAESRKKRAQNSHESAMNSTSYFALHSLKQNTDNRIIPFSDSEQGAARDEPKYLTEARARRAERGRKW